MLGPKVEEDFWVVMAQSDASDLEHTITKIVKIVAGDTEYS